MPVARAYFGIDPGARGSICLLVPETKQIVFYSTIAKPIDVMYLLKQAQLECNVVVAMIEDVHAIQGTSAKSNFSFGFNTGLVTGMIQGAGLSLDKVTPKKWQKFIGVRTKGKLIKKEVADICERLYPQAEIKGPRGGLMDGRSDALMIAHYAALTYN